MLLRRRLHGRRGLKFGLELFYNFLRCRRLHGRRGLKFRCSPVLHSDLRRRLHGRRGLKFDNYVDNTYAKDVAAFTGGVD